MKQTRMKYVVTIPEIVLLVVTIATLILVPVPWKPVFASPDALACYPSNYNLLGIIQTATPRR